VRHDNGSSGKDSESKLFLLFLYRAYPRFEQEFCFIRSHSAGVLRLKPLVSYLLFLVEVGKEHDVAKDLKKLPGVTESQVVYGEFDVVARVELSDLSLLDETVTMARRLPGVNRTSTLISSGIQTNMSSV
jgi:hypothetical protein